MTTPPVVDAGLPVRAFFTTRWGGVSRAPYDTFNLAGHVGDDPGAVSVNRSLLTGLAGGPVAFMAQSHGVTVALVTGPNGVPDADAIITRAPGLALGVLVADCVPLLLHDSGTGAVGAVHAGRAGVEHGIVGVAVSALREAGGSRSGAISASIGPSICGACYEVSEEMRARVAEAVPEAWATTSWGTPSLDLRAAVMAQLASAGVEEISAVDLCTREDSDLYSHRRDGVTGRLAGIIRGEAFPG